MNMPPNAGAPGQEWSSNPFMSAVNQMFKDFDEVSKQPGAPQDGGADPMMADFLKNFTKDLF